jgi:sugar lactone lactonase YvrE
MSIDDSDNLYVTEERGSRVLKFNSSGQNVLSIGTAGLNFTANNTLADPKDAIADSKGNIWVADSNRVVQYTSSGAFSQTIPAADSWMSGNDDTHFDGASGIAFDSAGRLFVSDSNNHRIRVYTITVGGAPVYSATIGVNGVSGSDNTHFNQPARITFDSSGRLYVVDTANYRVQRCTFAGSWTCSTFFGVTGVIGQ